jgi:hypothetical protein
MRPPTPHADGRHSHERRAIRAVIGAGILVLGPALVLGNADPAHAQSTLGSSSAVCQIVNCYTGPILGPGASPGNNTSRNPSGNSTPSAMPGAVTGLARRYDPGPVRPLSMRGPNTLLIGQAARFRITFGATQGAGRPVLVIVEPPLSIASARGRGAACDYNQRVAVCKQDRATPFAVDISLLAQAPGQYEIGAMGSAPTRVTVPGPASMQSAGSPSDCLWTYCRTGSSINEYPGFTREDLTESATCVTTKTAPCGGGNPAPRGLGKDELECQDAETCSFPGIAFEFPLTKEVQVRDARADLHLALTRRTSNEVFPGDPVVFDGTVQNLGPEASPPRKLSFRIPGNVQLKGLSNLRCQSDASPTLLVCDVAPLARPRGNGESRLSRSTRFSVTLLPLAPGRVTVTAALERDGSDAHVANNLARASVDVRVPTAPLTETTVAQPPVSSEQQSGTTITQTPGGSPSPTQSPGTPQPTSPISSTPSTHPVTTTTTHPATTTTTHELK